VNIIDIIPGGQPHGFTQAELEVTRLAGDGTGEVEVLVVDPISMHADVYELGFIDTLANLVFNLDGASKGRVISLLEPEASSADLTERHYLPTDNGFLISVRNHDKVNFLSKVWQTNESGSSYSFSDLSQPTGVSEERPGRYIVLFGDSTYKYPTSFVPGAAKVPFQIFNDIDDPDWQSPLILAVGTSFNAELPWQSGEVIQMLEGSGKKTWYFTVSWDSNDIEPAAGDIFQMNTSVPFNSEDIFRIEAFESEIADVNTDLNVKVVPNPYVIHSLTERRHPDALTTHDLRFINLPAHCDIYIHTINGDLVASLRHDSETVGEYHWNMLNQDRMEIAYGMYIYAIVPDTGKKQLGKFAVIW